MSFSALGMYTAMIQLYDGMDGRRRRQKAGYSKRPHCHQINIQAWNCPTHSVDDGRVGGASPS